MFLLVAQENIQMIQRALEKLQNHPDRTLDGTDRQFIIYKETTKE